MSQANLEDIEHSGLWRPLRLWLPGVLILSVSAAALTYAAFSLIAPRYQSEARIEIALRAGGDPIETHVRALRSPELGARIASELDLRSRAEFNPFLGAVDTMSALLRIVGIGGPPTGEREIDLVHERFMEGLEVHPQDGSPTIAIRFTSNDAVLSAVVANRLAEAYREALSARLASRSGEAEQALGAKIHGLREEVRNTEEAIRALRVATPDVKPDHELKGAGEQRLRGLQDELARAAAARSAADARVRSARALQGKADGEVAAELPPSALHRTLFEERQRIEVQISELSATLLPAHPQMRQLHSELAAIKKRIAGETAKLVDSLAKEARSAALREEELRRSIAALELRGGEKVVDPARLGQLEREAQLKRAELERREAELEALRASAAVSSAPVGAEIVARAVPPSEPVFPRKDLLAGVVGLATLILGVAISLVRSLGSGRVMVKTQGATGPAEGAARSSVVRRDIVPALEPRLAPPDVDPSPRSLAHAEAPSPATPQMHGCEDAGAARVASVAALVNRVCGAAGSLGGYRTMIASDGEAVPVASIAAETAKELADVGHSVILIDWSPEGMGIAEAVGLSGVPGIGDLLAGNATFEDVVHRLPESDAHVIGPGTLSDECVGTLDADRLNLILDALDEAYDHIIIAGRNEPARDFFETIEGRIDTGVTVADPARRIGAQAELPCTYLGFEVTEIELIRYERAHASTFQPERMARLVDRAEAV